MDPRRAAREQHLRKSRDRRSGCRGPLDILRREAVAELWQELVRVYTELCARLDLARSACLGKRALEDEGVRLGYVLVDALLSEEDVLVPHLKLVTTVEVVLVGQRRHVRVLVVRQVAHRQDLLQRRVHMESQHGCGLIARRPFGRAQRCFRRAHLKLDAQVRLAGDEVPTLGVLVAHHRAGGRLDLARQDIEALHGDLPFAVHVRLRRQVALAIGVEEAKLLLEPLELAHHLRKLLYLDSVALKQVAHDHDVLLGPRGHDAALHDWHFNTTGEFIHYEEIKN